MQVLVVTARKKFMAHLVHLLSKDGVNVVGLNCLSAAQDVLRLSGVDVLIMDETVGGRLTHSLSLLAERRNAGCVTLLMTLRTGSDLAEMYDLLPGLRGAFDNDASPVTVAKSALEILETVSDSALGNITHTPFRNVPSRPVPVEFDRDSFVFDRLESTA